MFSKTVFLCLATFVALVQGTMISGSDEAQERTFKEVKRRKLAPIVEKKKWLLSSLFSRSQPPEAIHTLAPLEQYPIWKIHKYKGIELRPVQVFDVPTTFDYSPQSFTPYVPSGDLPRMPHTEYGPPTTEFAAPVTIPETITEVQPTTFHHGGKLRALLALISHLKGLKSWKAALKQPQPTTGYAFALPPLPEVGEIPVKGLENLNIQIPELPAISLPSYSSTFPPGPSGPYLKVQVASPLPLDHSVSLPYYQPTVGVPAPYYGAPPLYDSYAMPLPPDAYSAPSEQAPTFAVPENLPKQNQNQIQQQQQQQPTAASPFDISVQRVPDLPAAKFAYDEKERGSETTAVTDEKAYNQSNSN